MTTTETTLSELPGTQRIKVWTKEDYLKWKPLVYLVQDNTRPYKMVENLQKEWFEKMLKENFNTLFPTRFFRFWVFQKELIPIPYPPKHSLYGKNSQDFGWSLVSEKDICFHTCYSLLRSEYEYFEDGLWECIKQFRYFSPNTHYFEVYPSDRMVDIYLRKGYQ